jgi:hypothetical protein
VEDRPRRGVALIYNIIKLNYMTKTIAILGDHIRGLEVINILRSMGAKNPFGFSGCSQEKIYYIDNGLIDGIERSEMDNDKFEFHTIDSYYHIYGKCGVDNYNLEGIKNKFNAVYDALKDYDAENVTDKSLLKLKKAMFKAKVEFEKACGIIDP